MPTIAELEAQVIAMIDARTALEEQLRLVKIADEDKAKQITSLQEVNQKLFLRASAVPGEEKTEEPIPTCEEFAKTIKI